MSINQRIEEIRKYYELSVNKFAEIVGISQPTAKAILEGGNAPSFKAINGIAIGFPNISMEWLFREEGFMIKGTADKLNEAIAEGSIKPISNESLRTIVEASVERAVEQALRKRGIA